MGDQSWLDEPFVFAELWPDVTTFAELRLPPEDAFVAELKTQRWELEDLKPCDLQFQIGTLPHLSLPNLSFPEPGNLSLEPLEDIDGLDTSSASFSDVISEPVEPENEQVRNPLQSDNEKLPKLKCWEDFYRSDSRLRQSSFVSEGGPETFDAILLGKSAQNLEAPPTRVLRRDAVTENLAELSLGRDSILYYYDRSALAFRARFGDVRPSGCSVDLFQSLESAFIQHASRRKSLEVFVQNTFAISQPARSLVSIASCIGALLYSIDILTVDCVTNGKSLLELENSLRRPFQLLKSLQELVESINKTASDERILSSLYRFASNFEDSTEMRSIAFKIFSVVTKPWLDTVGRWLGLGGALGLQGTMNEPAFIQAVEDLDKPISKKGFSASYELNQSAIPDFMSVAEAQKIVEAGQNLRMLRKHQPDHALIAALSSRSSPMSPLELRSSWEDIERIQAEAEEYRRILLNTITELDSSSTSNTISTFEQNDRHEAQPIAVTQSQETPESMIRTLNAKIDCRLSVPGPDGTDEFLQFVLGHLATSDRSSNEEVLSHPPLSLVPSLCLNPVIGAQAQLLDQSSLRMLFKGCQLRSHFSLHYRFSLLGDGIFSSRLSHALFAPDLPSAERRKGSPRLGPSGLNLGTRETWPPASSELRLALMGILNDSYRGQSHVYPAPQSTELPGGLSFAVRFMAEEDLQKCMDPNSVFALDFLRLQYKPPEPLDAVITPASLDKYDSIFRLLLRVLRVLHTVKELTRENLSSSVFQASDLERRCFRLEAFQFISSVCSYFFEGMNDSWATFEGCMETLEHRTERYELCEQNGIRALREMHESMLDEVMLTLLLRRRHEMVMALLEEIFAILLEFARVDGTAAMSASDQLGKADQAKELYRKWSKKLKVFINVCRGLSERKSSTTSDAGGRDRVSGIGKLLLRLDMNGYYGRQRR